jgi:hypothetical protein
MDYPKGAANTLILRVVELAEILKQLLLLARLAVAKKICIFMNINMLTMRASFNQACMIIIF